MDKAKIEARLVELGQLVKQMEANGNAALGAIEECRYWLVQLEQDTLSEANPEAKQKKDK